MKLLLTGSFTYTDEQLVFLTKLGYHIFMLRDERTPDNLNVADIEAVVCNNLFKYKDIRKFKNLKFVQLTSVGIDQLPMRNIEQAGIHLETARGVYSIPMAEWVVLKILEICKFSTIFYSAQQQHQWQKERGLEELAGKSAAIIGYGSLGTETARRLQAFDVKITAIDKRVPKPEEMKWIDELLPPEELDTVLLRSDIVILALPLTQQTFQLINKQKLKLMKKNSMLINVSRGPIIDQSALIEVLQQKKFAGVALDVFEEEPLETDSPLWDFENVLITPHNAFVSNKNHQRLFDLIYKNLNVYAKYRQQKKISADISKKPQRMEFSR